MKKSLLALIPLALMFAAIFAPVAFTTGPTQPPVDTTTMYVGTIGWGPRDADPKISYDTGSGALLFNSYEQLIAMGSEVTNEWGTWDVQEQYWEFEPLLSTNVPDRVEVTADFTNTSFVWTIVIRNEIPMGPEWLLEPNCTWWEDDLAQPFNSYHITDWIDSEPANGELGYCDYIQMNDYWWEPEIPLEVQLKGCSWWHVEDVQDHGDGWWKMILTYTTRTDFDPADPESTWWTSLDYPETYFHLVGFINNNPLEPAGLGECDVVFMMEYMWVPVDWIKIGPGWTLLPVTCRTWHVLGWDPGVTLHLHRWYYDFYLQTTPIYFVNETGDIVDTFDIGDVEFSFERGFVVDSSGGPNWMLALPTMDLHSMSRFNTGDPADWITGLYLIDDAFEIISYDPPIFRINTGIDFPDIAFKQVIAQSWSAIMSKEYTQVLGGWNGELFLDVDQDCIPDWVPIYWRTDDNPYETGWRYAGTGPFYVSIVDDVNDIVVLEKNDIYWRGWPAPDRKGYLDRVDIEYIAAWETRRDAFIACQVDICAVPRAYMMELLDEFEEPLYDEIVTIKNIYPGLALDATHYTFVLNPASPYIGTGSFPDGIPPDFFNNTHVRKAFSYAFNRTQYLEEGYHGEAICRETPLISGLAPDYYSYGPDPPYVYDEDLAMAKWHLQQANISGMPTFNVWEEGFYLVASYNTGNDQRMIANNMIRDFFTELSTYEGRTGNPFQIDIAEIDWPTYLTQWFSFNLPLWAVGWLSDYADADNWMGAYMHSWICFAYFQVYREDNGYGTPGPVSGLDKDRLVELAIKTPDGPERAAMYKDLEDIWIEDCPALPVAEPLGRAWRKYWVKGWYYNGLYPAFYYYKLYKEDTCYMNINGPTAGMPDDVTNMRDINWITAHFGAKPPYVAVPYDPKWAPGTYGYAGCDVYGDRKVDMRDIAHANAHFMHTNEP